MNGECVQMAKRRITGFDWSGTNIDRLKALLEQRLSASRIAVLLGGGVTRNAVIGKVHRLGLSLAGAGRNRMPRPAMATLVKRAAPAARVEADLTISRERDAKVGLTNAVCRSPTIVIAPTPPVIQTRVSGGVTIEGLRAGMCRYLLGEPGRREFRYCGRTCDVSRSYCAEHHAIVYRSTKVVARGAPVGLRARSARCFARTMPFFALACAFVLETASLCRPTQAQDASFGCKVLLCAAAASPSWPNIPYCVPVMQQLFSQIAKGGGWPACAQAGTSASNVGYQRYQDCPAGSIAVSAQSGQSGYAADSNGSSCVTAQDFQTYQARLDTYNQALNNQNGSVPQAPWLQTTARAANPTPYYVDLNTGSSGSSPTRFYFSLTPPRSAINRVATH
jgi:hypothetical protein